MNIQLRQNHISVVNKTEDAIHDSLISFEDATKHVNIPVKCLEGIWERILGKSVAPDPGQKLEARMVW